MPENLTLKGSETANRRTVERPFPRRVAFFFSFMKNAHNWTIVSYSIHFQISETGRVSLGILGHHV